MSSESEVARLRDIIARAYAASDNSGSASDAVQEMLWILDEADRVEPAGATPVEPNPTSVGRR